MGGLAQADQTASKPSMLTMALQPNGPEHPKASALFSLLPFPPIPGNTFKKQTKKASTKTETEMQLSAHSPLNVRSLLKFLASQGQ